MKKKETTLSDLLDKAKKGHDTELCIYCKKGEPNVLLIFQCHAHATCHAAYEAEKKETIN